MITPNPYFVHVPGGGTATFDFDISISGGSGSYTVTWSRGPHLSFHAFSDEETDDFVAASVVDNVTGATGSATADAIAYGY